MKSYKLFITIGVVVSIVVLALFFWKTESNLINVLLQGEVDEISIEDTSILETIEITDKEDIKNIVEKLQLEEWNRKTSWDLEYAPSFFIAFGENRHVALFGSGEIYAKVVTEEGIGYYTISAEIYDEIYSIFSENRQEPDKEQ